MNKTAAFIRENHFKLFLLIAVLIALIAHLIMAITGWNQSINGGHMFRQSQTAIATYYILEEGPSLHYTLPVLGPNWEMPYEFPAYQVLVAWTVKATGMQLDQAGRLISLMSFYAAAACAVMMLWILRLGWLTIAGMLILLLTSSPYIFWSRCFLIESFSLAVSLSYVVLVLAFLRFRSPALIVAALLIGPFAALVKVTTFTISAGFLILYLTALKFPGVARKDEQPQMREFMAISATIIASLIAAVIWADYTAGVRAGLVQFAESTDSLMTWLFGTWSQRLEPDFWKNFYEMGIRLPFGSALLLLVGITAFACAPTRERMIAFCAFGAWCSGFLVWANVFAIHDYYAYENSLFLIIWAAISMSSISEFQAKLRWPIAALFIAFGVGQINHYKQSDYYQSQINDWAKEQVDFSKVIGQESPKDGVLLIFGEDWNPTIPYYSERYANMIRWTGFWKSSIFAESIRITEEQGRFICGIVTVNAEPFLSELHGLSEKWGYILEEPIYSSNKRWAYYPIKPASNVENRP